MEVIFSLDEIEKTAALFLKDADNKKVIALHGEMGAGKTTFVHAVCNLLQVKDVISSPTFSIINEYVNKNGESVYHIDLYRLKDEQEAIQAGVEDCFYSGKYCFVEWPEKTPHLFPENTLHIYLSVVAANMRKLKIK